MTQATLVLGFCPSPFSVVRASQLVKYVISLPPLQPGAAMNSVLTHKLQAMPAERNAETNTGFPFLFFFKYRGVSCSVRARLVEAGEILIASRKLCRSMRDLVL